MRVYWARILHTGALRSRIDLFDPFDDEAFGFLDTVYPPGESQADLTDVAVAFGCYQVHPFAVNRLDLRGNEARAGFDEASQVQDSLRLAVIESLEHIEKEVFFEFPAHGRRE